MPESPPVATSKEFVVTGDTPLRGESVESIRRSVAPPVATNKEFVVSGDTTVRGEVTVPEPEPFVVTGVTTLRQEPVENIPDDAGVPSPTPREPVALRSEPQPQPEHIGGLPADDPEIAARLRAYLEFDRGPLAFVRRDIFADTDRYEPIHREILRDNVVRVRGGWDVPELASVPGPAWAKAPVMDVDLRAQSEPEAAPQSPIMLRPGTRGDNPTGGEGDQDCADTPGWSLEFTDKGPAADKVSLENPDFDPVVMVKNSLPPETHITLTNTSEHGLDVQVEKVFTSVMERIQTTDLERGRARFDIETDQGTTIRVRLTVDNNMVSARIDAPTEQARDLLAGHAWQLNQQLQTEGLIPGDIEFGLAGGREQTYGHSGQPAIAARFGGRITDEDTENLTMVETQTYAFESWA
jgi:hypothetical protein